MYYKAIVFIKSLRVTLEIKFDNISQVKARKVVRELKSNPEFEVVELKRKLITMDNNTYEYYDITNW